MSNPEVSFHTLPHTDGSATYSHAGYQIVAAVNGPIEPQRRDELPEEAFIEVNLRPATGTGGTRERHLERLIHSTLRSIILTHIHPRSLIQLTLQILLSPSFTPNAAPPLQSASALPPLPHLLHAALLALLAANIPLSTTYTAALVVVISERDGDVEEIIVDPKDKNLRDASSMHVFAYTKDGALALAESEGMFDVETWEKAAGMAERRCRGGKVEVGEEIEMVEGEEGAKELQVWLRGLVAEDVAKAARWKGSL